MKDKAVILGGGLAGLSAAHSLGGRAAVYEQCINLGGLCGEIKVDGFRFDAVPHVMHFQREESRRFVDQLLGGDLLSFERRAHVYSHNIFTRYPFQAHLFGLGPRVISECLEGRKAAPGKRPGASTNFEDWVLSNFGSAIARHFMFPFNEKFWGLPASCLTSEWVDGIIPVPTVQETVCGAMHEDPSEYGYNTRFWYPAKGGTGAVVKALLKHLPEIHLGKRLSKIDTAGRRLEFDDGDRLDYERLLSSIPLPELARLLDPLPDGVGRALRALRWVSICVVHLGVRGPAARPYHWIYSPEADISFYRVGIPSLYAPDAAPKGYHVLSAEIAYSSWKPLERKTLVPRVTKDLKRMGLLPSTDSIVVEVPVELKYGYPVYDENYRWAAAYLRDYLNQHGITPLGRFGSWRYLSMEETILEGQQAARSVRGPVSYETIYR